jgi:hypothetical protein
VEADSLDHLASTKCLKANLATCRQTLTTGVAGVGEFVEIGVEPRRSIRFFKDGVFLSQVPKHKALGDDLMEIGASHSSDEAE